MIEKNIDNESAKKDKLLKLSLREIRLEAKKLSLHLYSRKTKKELVELLLKDQKNLLIENKSNDDVVAEEDRLAIEEAKEEERIALEEAKEKERIALEKAKEEERIAFLKKLQLITIEKTNVKEKEYIISNKNKNLKTLLSKSFPNKKITVTDNKDGSQTILIN
tara:strand:+ start:283 stop:774 length:492 start_codon:yes stop_codon:yes gene_type:complete